MGRLFEVTDDLGLDREEITVPLERRDPGAVERSPGAWRIELPAEGLDDFLEALPARVRELSG